RNRQYFATARQAIFAGYRACKRCRPLDTDGRQPDWVKRLLSQVEEKPIDRLTDADLRAQAIDPARARRYFLKHYGMTFHAYSRGRRMGEAFTQIRQGQKLDDVILGNGYESHSGFREAFARTFGSSPGQSRNGDCIVAAWVESPLGPLVAGATTKGLCLLEFTDRRMLEAQFTTIRQRFGCAVVPGKHEHLAQLQHALRRYFAGKLTEFRVPLVFPG